MTSPELTADLERLVMRALETPYSSFSATDDSETGNRYQAVGLGDRSTRGMREDRSRFLDALDLRGRTVLTWAPTSARSAARPGPGGRRWSTASRSTPTSTRSHSS